jgi:hypothetical protein
LEQIQGIDIGSLDTRDIPETPDDVGVGGIMDDEGTEPLAVSSIAHFTSTGPKFLGGTDLVDVRVGIDASEEGDSIFCLDKGSEVGIFNDEGDFEDRLDPVTTGHDEGGDSGSSDGRDSGISLFVEVDLDVPLAPGLCGSKTAATTAHVAKGSLAGSMSSSAADTGDTSDSSACAPGLGRGLTVSNVSLSSSSVVVLIYLVTSFDIDGVRLTLILRNGRVDAVDDIRSNGGLEDGGERKSISRRR